MLIRDILILNINDEDNNIKDENSLLHFHYCKKYLQETLNNLNPINYNPIQFENRKYELQKQLDKWNKIKNPWYLVIKFDVSLYVPLLRDFVWQISELESFCECVTSLKKAEHVKEAVMLLQPFKNKTMVVSKGSWDGSYRTPHALYNDYVAGFYSMFNVPKDSISNPYVTLDITPDDKLYTSLRLPSEYSITFLDNPK